MGVLIIAEPGSTAEGDRAIFLALIHLAKSLGCDVFKNQWVSNPGRLCERRRALAYREAYEKIAYDLDLHADLASEVHANGLAYGCSVYLPEDVDRIAPYCDYLKCASFESFDAEMLEAFHPYQQRTIVSLGMASDGAGVDLSEFVGRLHCISSYPAPAEQMNLAAIRRRNLNGLSDHSKHPWTGALGLAAGATRFIEFHVRLDDTDPANPDYAVARDPREAAEYVANIRQAERVMGDGLAVSQPCEAPMERYRVRP